MLKLEAEQVRIELAAAQAAPLDSASDPLSTDLR
jgi:hypothetical protein